MNAARQTPDQISELLASMCEYTPDVEEVIWNSDGPMWSLELRGDTVIVVELSADGHSLCLRADLGQPPAQHRLRVCEALMTYTSLRQETGGITMALTGVGGDVIQLCDIPAFQLDAQGLGTIVINFAEKARLWRHVVAEGASSEAPSLLDFGSFGGAIRC